VELVVVVEVVVVVAVILVVLVSSPIAFLVSVIVFAMCSSSGI
jgi:hypothetical protein